VLSVREQPGFAGGMFQSVAAERIPENGAWDIENGLLEEDGAVNSRGGSVTASSALSALRDLTWIYSGYIGSTAVTLVADSADYGSLAAGVMTNLGGAGRTSPAGRQAVMGTVLYLPGGVETISNVPAIAAAPAKVAPYYAAVANRLLAGNGRRIDFSGIGTPGTFGATDFHELPDGVSLIGLEGLRDSAVCFTTRGVYIISGLALNLTDADGNVQQRIDRYSRDGVLWGDAGIAGWEGGLVCPMRDGVWLISLGVASEAVQAYQLMSRPVADRYKGYVDAGCTPGGAAVYRGHYILPILSGSTCVDTLVCRLDMSGAPWVHMVGAGARFAAVTVTPTGQLLAAGAAGRVYTLNWFDKAAVTDVDGSSVAFRLRTRDIAASRVRSGLVKLRAEYELSTYDAATPLATDPLLSVSAALNARAATLGGNWATAPSATDFSVANGAKRTATDVQYAVLGAANVTGRTRAQLNRGTLNALLSPQVGILHRYVSAANHARALILPLFGVTSLQVSKVIGGVETVLQSGALTPAEYAAWINGTTVVRFSATAAGVWKVELVDTGGTPFRSWSGTDAVFATGGALQSGQGGIVDLGNFGGATGHLWLDFAVETIVATSAGLDAYLVEGPTQDGYQSTTSLGSAPSNLTVGQEPATYTWPVAQSSRYGRFEFRCDDPVSRLSLRELEVFVRESGRQ
jgi:hypothetical protein